MLELAGKVSRGKSCKLLKAQRKLENCGESRVRKEPKWEIFQ